MLPKKEGVLSVTNSEKIFLSIAKYQFGRNSSNDINYVEVGVEVGVEQLSVLKPQYFGLYKLIGKVYWKLVATCIVANC